MTDTPPQGFTLSDVQARRTSMESQRPYDCSFDGLRHQIQGAYRRGDRRFHVQYSCEQRPKEYVGGLRSYLQGEFGPKVTVEIGSAMPNTVVIKFEFPDLPPSTA